MAFQSTETPLSAHAAYIAAADEIGRHLCADAIWHEGRCNWIGALPEEGPGGSLVDAYTTLTSDLYGGTSGVAVFLANLYRFTGDVATRKTALGAIRQAVARSVEKLSASNRGLYGGRPGVALAAACVGRLLGEDTLLEKATQLFEGADAEPGVGREYDLISGAAGALVGCLMTSEMTGEQSLLSRAAQLGDELIASAQKTESGWSWSSPTNTNSENLTGFSHGAAGVGYALLELHRATRDVRYRAGAEQAFMYERGLFDEKAGNWPDLRQPHPGQSRFSGRVFATFWCHGAPGIGLCRLRGFELLGDSLCRREAELALETTRRSVEADIEVGSANYSICHGLAGNAEVLLYGEQVLGASASESGRLANRVAALGISSYPARGKPWPCGTRGGQSPGLFLGLAGIGLFYLRLVDPAIPSVLIPRGEAFSRLALPRIASI